MALHNHEDDSALAKEFIGHSKKVAKMFREVVEADRHSRGLSTGASEKRWTEAALKRNQIIADLKVDLVKIAEEI